MCKGGGQINRKTTTVVYFYIFIYVDLHCLKPKRWQMNVTKRMDCRRQDARQVAQWWQHVELYLQKWKMEITVGLYPDRLPKPQFSDWYSISKMSPFPSHTPTYSTKLIYFILQANRILLVFFSLSVNKSETSIDIFVWLSMVLHCP